MSERFPIPFGRYQLVEQLAVGGMAELYLARASGAHGFAKTVVIKRLLPHLATDAHFNAMFIDEAKLTARLAHPKIAQTFELGRFDEQLYIAMEFVDGLDALSLLRECAHRHRRLPPEVGAYIAHEVLDALDFAHNQVDSEGRPLGVVHRDISPSNVLLSRRGDVKLVDFGIARASEQQHDTKAGTLKGKYGYMSPEQVLEEDIDSRSDLFSVGIVLAELLTGRRLFAAPNELDVLLMVRDVNLDRLDRYGGDLDADLDAILRKALSKSPDDRHPSAGAFRDDIAEWLFEKRHRVTPQTIAEIVEDLYDHAWERKRKGVASGKAAVDAVVGEVPESDRHVDGIPDGNLRVTDSVPVISIEEEESGPVIDEAPAITSRELELAATATTDRARRHDESGNISIDLTDLLSEGDLPDFDIAPSTGNKRVIVEEATPQPIAEEHSVRYPNIEAAVASLASKKPHPSTLEFDELAEDRPPSLNPVPSPDEVAGASEPQPPTLDDIDDEPDDTGSFAEIPPIAVLYRLAVSRATGLLVARCAQIKKEIYSREGVPEYVSSNMAGELFGEYLVTRGVLTAGELSMALAMMPHYSGRLGDTLVGLGLLKPLEVFRYLTRQVRDKLIDVCTWSKGDFTWYGGRENPREAFPLDLNSFEVLGAGAMRLPAEPLLQWCERAADRRPRSERNTKVSPEQFELGAALRDVYDHLDGRHTIAELRARFTDEEDELRFLRMLFLLLHTEMAA